MPLIHAILVANTGPGTPRPSASVSYNGTVDRSVQVKPLCPTWDTEDPACLVAIQVQQSFDNEATWEDFARLDIHPPMRNRAGDIPYMGCQVVDNLGQRRVRILLTVEGASLPIGVDVTT